MASGATKVLVVDDEPTLVDLLETLLRLAGYEVVTAGGGEAALKTINQARPDIVVLDINMPVLDGFGVLAALAANPPAKSPSVLVLTARYATDDIKRAKTLGAADYLSKPFSNKTLLARIGRLVGA